MSNFLRAAVNIYGMVNCFSFEVRNGFPALPSVIRALIFQMGLTERVIWQPRGDTKRLGTAMKEESKTQMENRLPSGVVPGVLCGFI